MISIDFESGQIFIGQTSVSVQLTDDEGYLHLNYPDGPILRPLSVMERLRLIQYALTANNAPGALTASILHEATVKPGVGDYTLYGAVALHLAGGGLKAPPIYQAISLVARHTGWHPNEIFSADAAQIDHMASALAPASSPEWTRVLMLDAGQDEVGAVANDLAASLIGRMDVGQSGDLNHAGQNQDTGSISHKAQSHPGSANGLQSPRKKVLTDATALQDRINSQRIRTDRDQPFTFDRARKASSSDEPLEKNSRRETSPAAINQTGESSSTGSARWKKGETSDKTNIRNSPDEGFVLKKIRGHLQNNAQSRPLSSIRSNAPASGTDETVISFSRPGTPKPAAEIDHGRNSTPVAAGGKIREPELTLQRHLDPIDKFGAGFDSTSTGARPEGLTLPDIVDEQAAAGQTLPGRHRIAKRTAGSAAPDRIGLSHHRADVPPVDALDHDIAAFFGYRQASVAEELADSLNREADLRGIE